MDTTDSSSTVMSLMMTPYLHFTGGDALFFKQLAPESKGAIAGASIVLFFVALLERYVVAKRMTLEAHWKQRAKIIANERVVLLRSSYEDRDFKSAEPSATVAATRTRTIPPFILTNDVPRGVMHAVQSLIHFGLMLAVMTFQVAYIIAIIVGLGVGEGIFGRLSAGSAHM